MIREAGLGQYDPLCLRFRQFCQLLCPRRCPFCGRVLGYLHGCPACEEELRGTVRRHNGPRAIPHDGMRYCVPVWAAAPFWYEGGIRRSLIGAKYESKPWIAVQLGCLMARELFGVEIQLKGGVEVPQPLASPPIDCDLVVPVPSSNRGRPYNVPALMARPLARGLGLPLEENALCRLVPGRPQASLSRQERLVSVIGQFAADADCVAGRRVFLIDDVVTTGSTAAACTQALLAAGAVSVAFAALAVPRGKSGLPASPGIPFDVEDELEQSGLDDTLEF